MNLYGGKIRRYLYQDSIFLWIIFRLLNMNSLWDTYICQFQSCCFLKVNISFSKGRCYVLQNVLFAKWGGKDCNVSKMWSAGHPPPWSQVLGDMDWITINQCLMIFSGKYLCGCHLSSLSRETQEQAHFTPNILLTCREHLWTLTIMDTMQKLATYSNSR